MGSLARVAYSPGEFAELFGKSQTWGYRQIYAGKVNAITEHGRILIPAKEVERILESAGIYDGKPSKPMKPTKTRRTPEQETVWQRYLKMRAQAPVHAKDSKSAHRAVRGPAGLGAESRKALLGKIKSAWSHAKSE
jgi:hypothetical protein